MKASPLRFPVPFSASSLALILLLTGCGSPEQDASNKLVNRGFEASSESFFEAVSVGDPAVLPLFREAGLSIDSLIDAEGNTGLILAAAAGKTEMVQALLDAGLDPRAVNTAGRTALIEASGKGFTDVARLLVGRGADLDAQDNEGWTALNLAAFNGQSDTVEFLAGKSEQESLDGALLVACFRGDTAVIDQLLNRGAYINARSPSGQTPLMIAAQGGHEDVIRLLLQNQANPFALDEEERTAAMLAEK
ncbi:MAG: ankyrin repeat domain-containing protein, partial [Verrucomicrobiae bacterium]|nr:ankyrin repeat domain-containing protein [Verrucomicrobiae bacterium]